ncbi:uncharacterized protein VTP21DRAFT_5699 [Calcarisporiella thermophila]|uniref:uncharacterized protein n=1 Tax=Calcarisporiella thermophila TaxID=911321 RepID=UPI00374206A3
MTAAGPIAMVPTLTATALPSRAEINLRRILARCDRHLSEDKRALHGRDKLKFLNNIKYMRKLLVEIGKDAEEPIDPTAIAEYERKIQNLANMIDEDKLMSSVEKTLSQARLTRLAHQTQWEKNKEIEQEVLMQRRVERELKEELLKNSNLDTPEEKVQCEEEREEDISVNENTEISDNRTLQEKKAELFAESSKDAALRTRKSYTFDAEGTENMETVLQHHRVMQEELTNDLIRMAQTLKANSVAFGDILKRDEKLLEDAQTVLSANLTTLQKENKRLGRYRTQSSKTTMFIWAVMLAVCLLWAVMFVVIRVLPKSKA